ncbi:hypothetical protein ABH936_002144 [Dermacoccus sp. GAS27A]
MSPHPSKPWFGPKRIGWGISPRTWQGYLVTIIGSLVLAAIVVAVAALLS